MYGKIGPYMLWPVATALSWSGPLIAIANPNLRRPSVEVPQALAAKDEPGSCLCASSAGVVG